MISIKSHINVSLGYFLMAALLGVLLRTFVVSPMPIPINYRFIVHTHSHIALLGWVYIALTSLLYHLFLSKQGLHRKYGRIFWFTQLCLVGMLLSFPFQGYALFSIVFSTLFLVASYWFTGFFIKNVPKLLKGTNAYRCLKVALWFMVGSSVGPWAMGPIMTLLGPESIWYRLAIYFYLHFQYNGWMVFALIGLLIYFLEQHRIMMSPITFKVFFWSSGVGIILSSFLSALWTGPGLAFFLLGGMGAILQLVGLLILIRFCYVNRSLLKSELTTLQYGVLVVVSVLLLSKMLLQLLSSLPYFANLAATIMDFTIGYLHWTFLGVISVGVFFFLEYYKLIKLTKLSNLMYLLGFVFTEVLIFYKGMAAWQRWPLVDGYLMYLAYGSVLIPIAILLILWRSNTRVKGIV
ncbi:hypothetical protein KCTC52924_02841 [Arenibacter antarcticus]|uniref:Cytochrome C and Quinol oxidase polypeptide I n=1 Tax=Arenibacter antarcticus TaxID=2040469 RepID=A0ABW5VG54_9FLAO|nr:hypothetical protein [Arenibacter sp. H213]MCM4167260.1 hypothetical protein [Arenibacter sp. H213]